MKDFAQIDAENRAAGRCIRCGGGGVVAAMRAINRTGDPHLNQKCRRCGGTGKLHPNDYVASWSLGAPRYAADDCGRPVDSTPNIYTPKDAIDRAEAERMLSWYLFERFGIRNPRFKWKGCGMIVLSISMTGAGERRHHE